MSRVAAVRLVGNKDLHDRFVFPPRPLPAHSRPMIEPLPKTAGPSHGTKHHGCGRARRTGTGVDLVSAENRKTLLVLGLRLSCQEPMAAGAAYRIFTRLYQSDGAVLLGGQR